MKTWVLYKTLFRASTRNKGIKLDGGRGREERAIGKWEAFGKTCP